MAQEHPIPRQSRNRAHYAASRNYLLPVGVQSLMRGLGDTEVVYRGAKHWCPAHGRFGSKGREAGINSVSERLPRLDDQVRRHESVCRRTGAPLKKGHIVFEWGESGLCN